MDSTDLFCTQVSLLLIRPLINGLKNNFGVEAFLVGVSQKDTNFTYSVRTKQKINKKTLIEAKAYCLGFENAIQSIS